MKTILVAVAVFLLSACGTGPLIKSSEESDKAKGIRLAIRENVRPIKACYEAELKQDAGFSGELTMEWDIDDKGVVSNIKRKSGSIIKESMVRCVAKQIEGIKFSPSEPGNVTTVSYPFKFLQ